MLRRHAGVFSKRDRLSRPFGVTQQAYRFFTHSVNTLDAVQIVTTLPANQPTFILCNQFIQTCTQRADLAFNHGFIVTRELNDIEPEHLFIGNVGNQLTHRMPDDIFPCQVQYFRIDGFNRQGARFYHKGRIAQRGVKGVILNIDQPTNLRQRRNIQSRFGNERQRAFRTGENTGQVKLSHLIVKNVAKVITGEEAVKFGKFVEDQLTVVATAFKDGVVNTPRCRLLFG